MSYILSIPEQAPRFLALAPATDAAGRTSSYFSVKTAAKAYFYVAVAQGNAATIAIDVLQASAVAGTGSKAIAGTCRIWSCADAATDPRTVRQADAASFTTSAALANKLVCIEIDPAVNLDIAGGFDCIAIRTGASNVANITSGELQFIAPRFAQALPVNPRLD